MPQQIVASELLNIVKYRTDRASFKKVRNDMKKLRNDFSKTEGKIAQTKMKADRQIHQAQAKQQKEVEKQQKQQAKQAAQDAKQQANDQKKLAAAQSKAAKIQLQQQAKTAKVGENAMLAQRKALFDIGRLHLSGADRFQAIKHAQSLVNQYQQGAISLRDMNQQLSQHLSTQRAIARHNAKQARQSGQPKGKGRTGSSSFVSSNAAALIPSQLLGGAAAAYLGQQAYNISQQMLAEALQRNQGRKMIQSFGGSDLEYMALRQESLKRTGFDISREKYADISKDWLDKQGDLSFGATDKKGNFTGGGELSDLVNIMRQRLGYTNEGAVEKLNSFKTPVDFAVFMKGLKDGRKLTEQEYVNFGERVNDMSFILNSVTAGGENIVSTMKTLVDTGSVLNSTQQNHIDNLNAMAAVWQTISESGSDRFALGFAEAMQQGQLNANNLSEKMAGLNPLMEELGKEAGSVALQFANAANSIGSMVNWLREKFPSWFSGDNAGKPAAQAIYDGAVGGSADSVAQWFSDHLGADPRNVGKTVKSWFSEDSIAGQAQAGGFMNQMMPSTPSMAYQPVIPDLKADFNLTVTPSAEFGTMLEAKTDQRIKWAFDDQAFQINQSMLGE